MLDPKSKQKTDFMATKWIDPGIGDFSVKNQQLSVTGKLLKDLRLLVNFSVLKFMSNEGARMAYNKAIQDFILKIE